MSFRLKIGDEIRDYGTMKGSNESDGEDGHRGPVPLYWETPCGHWDYEDGNKYEYGCEHLECARECSRYGIQPYTRDRLLAWIPVTKPLAFIILLFVHPALPFLLLISDFIACYTLGSLGANRIEGELDEFKMKHTVGGIKAEQIVHHTGSKNDHFIPKCALWVRLLPEMIRTADMLFVFYLLTGVICLAIQQYPQFISWDKVFTNLFLPTVFFGALALALRRCIPFKWFFDPYLETVVEPKKTVSKKGPEKRPIPASAPDGKKYGEEYFTLHYPPPVVKNNGKGKPESANKIAETADSRFIK